MDENFVFSSEDSYHHYFGDDDVADPDYINESNEESSDLESNINVKIENSSFSAESHETLLNNTGLDTSALNNELKTENKVERNQKRKNFNLATPLEPKAKKRKYNMIRRNVKKEPERHDNKTTGDIEVGRLTKMLSNLNQLLGDNAEGDKVLPIDYISTLIGNSEHILSLINI